jgi:hypothetical protein
VEAVALLVTRVVLIDVGVGSLTLLSYDSSNNYNEGWLEDYPHELSLLQARSRGSLTHKKSLCCVITVGCF